SFLVNALRQSGEFLGLQSNQEKSAGSVFLFKNIQNLGRISRIWTIVKSKRSLFFLPAILLDLVRLRQHCHFLGSDQSCVRVNRNRSLTWTRLPLNIKNLAVAFTINIFARRHLFQFLVGAWVI